MKVFVYGTLQRDHGNNRLLSGSTFVSKAVVRGYELYYSGFPVANPNPDTIITGEIWDIGEGKTAEKVTYNLDCLEGYYEHAPDRSMYHRVKGVAYDDEGSSHEVSFYQGNETYWRGFAGLRKCSYDENSKTYTWERRS